MKNLTFFIRFRQVVNELIILVLLVNTTALGDTATAISSAGMLTSISFTLSSPNGGQSWSVGTSQQIVWSYTGPSDKNVVIEYSTDAGSNWLPVTNVLAASSPYSWQIPNTTTTSAKVRLKSDDYPLLGDTSSSVFTIYQPTLTLTSPNGGENWVVGTQQNITWTSTYVTYINLEYTTNNGTNWTTIIATIPTSAGSYAWTIPNTPSPNYKVRVSDASNNNLTDTSDSEFTIFELLTAPSNLTATAPAPGRVDLSWLDNSNNELGFVITRKNGTSASSDSLMIIDTVGNDVIVFSDTTIADSVKYSYRVYAFSLDTISAPSNFATITTLSSVKEILPGEIPKEYNLSQNYPNPFNPSTTIRYGLPFTSNVTIDVFNMIGQRISRLVEGEQTAGYYEATFRIDELPGGIYFYLINAKQTDGEKNFHQVRKMLFLK